MPPCGHEDCCKSPVFGVDGSKKREFCSQHKKKGMVDVANKRCRHSTCLKRAKFGFEGSRKREFCFQHKKPGMVSLCNKKCEHKGCFKNARFGVDGSREKEFCFQHKRDDMVDLVSKRCSHGSCHTRAWFGVEGRSPEFCSKHRKDHMVNLQKTKQSSAAGKRKRVAREKNDGGSESALGGESAWESESDDSGDEDWLPRNFESNGSTATRRDRVTSRRHAPTLTPPVSVDFSDEGDGNGTEKGVSSEDLADTEPDPYSYVGLNSCLPVQNGTVAAPVNPMAAASPAPTPALVDALEEEEDPHSKYSTDTDPGASSDVGPRGTIAAPVPTHPLPRHASSVPDPHAPTSSSCLFCPRSGGGKCVQ
ncbi:unnamed protein product [Ectocarpus sp. 6 AP-2014]